MGFLSIVGALLSPKIETNFGPVGAIPSGVKRNSIRYSCKSNKEEVVCSRIAWNERSTCTERYLLTCIISFIFFFFLFVRWTV